MRKLPALRGPGGKTAVQTVAFRTGAGAGAVTKLVRRGTSGAQSRIQRIFAPKYPYEYLRDIEKIRCGVPARGIPSYEERVFEFFRGE